MTPLIFSTSSSLHLLPDILKLTHTHLAAYRLGRFADGEISLYLDEPVEGRVCLVLGDSGSPAERLLELLTLIHTLHINGAQKIITILPYLGYSRSDRQKPLQPINSRLFLKFLSEAGTDKFVSLDLHSPTLEKYFPKPNLHLSPKDIFAPKIRSLHLSRYCIASPDLGGVERAQAVATALGLDDITIVEKHRPTDDSTSVTRICGDDLKGVDVVFIDDMIQTGHTLLNAVKAVKIMGAARVFVFATHCVYPAKGIKLLSSSSLISKIFVTNSLSQQYKLSNKISILDISPLLSAGISSLL